MPFLFVKLLKVLISFGLATDTSRNNYKDCVKCWVRKLQCFLRSEVGEPIAPLELPKGRKPNSLDASSFSPQKGVENASGELLPNLPLAQAVKLTLFSLLYEENRGPDGGSGSLKTTKVESGKCFNS